MTHAASNHREVALWMSTGVAVRRHVTRLLVPLAADGQLPRVLVWGETAWLRCQQGTVAWYERVTAAVVPGRFA